MEPRKEQTQSLARFKYLTSLKTLKVLEFRRQMKISSASKLFHLRLFCEFGRSASKLQRTPLNSETVDQSYVRLQNQFQFKLIRFQQTPETPPAIKKHRRRTPEILQRSFAADTPILTDPRCRFFFLPRLMHPNSHENEI